MEVRVSTISHEKFLLAIAACVSITAVCFCLYVISQWWMFFCCLLAYFSQLSIIVLNNEMFNHSVTIDTEADDYETTLSDLESEEKKYKLINGIGIILIVLINAFPFFAMNKSFANLCGLEPYEGGLLVSFLTLVAIVLWIFALYIEMKLNVIEDFEEKLNRQIEEHEKIKKSRQQKIAEENAIKSHYGDNAIVIKVNSTKVIFSKQNKCIEIYGEAIPFTSILSCSLIDNSKTESTTTTNGDVKTSTNSMLGRAVVGGVLTGGLGAVAGAATAKKNISTDTTSITTTTHDYIIYVNVNSLQKPVISIHIGKDIDKAQKLAGLFNVIIKRNK